MEEKIKKPFYKRWWFVVITIIVIIGVIGSLGDDKKEEQAAGEKNGIQAIETIGQNETVPREITQENEEEKVELSDAEKASLIMGIMEDSFEDMADIRYIEEYKAFIFDLKGDVVNSVLLLVLEPNNRELAKSWDGVVENFRKMSMDISENFGIGYQIHIANPANADNVILSIAEGMVFLNFMDELR